MDGTEKMKPVIIGQSENPKCFKNINKLIYYRNNKKAWMTEQILNEWLTKQNKLFATEKRHALLFLDNFGGHLANKGQLPYKFSNISLQYYPPN